MTNFVPAIDFQRLMQGDPAQREALGRCVREVGFAKVSNTPISQETLDKTFAIYRRFFEADEAVMNAVDQAETGTTRGWGRRYSEQVNPNVNPDYKEHFDIGHEFPADFAGRDRVCFAPNNWPDVTGFKAQVLDYYNLAFGVSKDILRQVALVADLDADHFVQHFDTPMTMLRCNHYPERPGDTTEQDYGIAEHTDYGCLTFLATDGVPGLEVKLRSDDWEAIEPEAGEFVINFGDMLQTWSGGRIVATPHRVKGSEQERYSIPLFFNPNADVNIRPAGQEPQTAEAYLQSRYEDTYRHLKKST